MGFTINGWAPCNGQILSIAQNSARFALLGTQVRGRRAQHLRAVEARRSGGGHERACRRGSPCSFSESARCGRLKLRGGLRPRRRRLAFPGGVLAAKVAAWAGRHSRHRCPSTHWRALASLRTTLQCRTERTRDDVDALDLIDTLLGVDCHAHATDLDLASRYERSASLWSRCGAEHERDAYDRWVGLGRFARASNPIVEDEVRARSWSGLQQRALVHLLAGRRDRVAATLRRAVAAQEGVLESLLPDALDAPVHTTETYWVALPHIEPRSVHGAWLSRERCALAMVEAQLARRPLHPAVTARCMAPVIPEADQPGVEAFHELAALTSVVVPPEPDTSLTACAPAEEWLAAHLPRSDAAGRLGSPIADAIARRDGVALRNALRRGSEPISHLTYPPPLTARTLVTEAAMLGHLPAVSLSSWLTLEDPWLRDALEDLPRVLTEREALARHLGAGETLYWCHALSVRRMKGRGWMMRRINDLLRGQTRPRGSRRGVPPNTSEHTRKKVVVAPTGGDRAAEAARADFAAQRVVRARYKGAADARTTDQLPRRVRPLGPRVQGRAEGRRSSQGGARLA